MKNPWETIRLSDYENHMQLNSVMQLQTMNTMMKKQFNAYPIKTVMVLGVAGGNGLEHIDEQKIHKVYGVDINYEYLNICAARYKNLMNVLECICTDLTAENNTLPYADMIIANLLIEYIGYECFKNIIMQIKPIYISCIIQINMDDSFVSYSPYIHVFDDLEKVHHHMQENELVNSMEEIDYYLIYRTEQVLPNGKKLVQLDFKRQF